jgi:hypothetical protein
VVRGALKTGEGEVMESSVSRRRFEGGGGSGRDRALEEDAWFELTRCELACIMGEVKRMEFVGSGSVVEDVVLVLWLAMAKEIPESLFRTL